MSELPALVFDMDDTLYSECAFAMSGFAAVAKAYAEAFGDARQTEADMRRLFATGFRNRIFNTLMRERDMPVDDEMVRDMVHEYRTHAPRIDLHPDSAAALERLRPAYQFGLITDGPAVMQANKINALGLRDFIDELIITDEWGDGYAKPNNKAFELMASKLGVAHDRCIYVADNPKKDFLAPNSLGWTTVRIVRPDGIYRDEQPIPGGKPQHEITTLDDLDGCLGRR